MTVMIFVLTVIFVVCWTPYHVMNFISVYKQWLVSSGRSTPPSRAAEQSTGSTTALVVANIVAQALTFVSSCCNPFIYYISSRNFRTFISLRCLISF